VNLKKIFCMFVFLYFRCMKIKIWLWQAPIGLMLVGAGLSMAIDAGSQKADGQPWFWYGTLALVLFNAGLCVFGGAIIKRVKDEMKG
jgi:hypothetical protein